MIHSSLFSLTDLRAAAEAEWVGPWPRTAINALCDVVQEANKFLDTNYGYLSEPTRQALEPLVAALEKIGD